MVSMMPNAQKSWWLWLVEQNNRFYFEQTISACVYASIHDSIWSFFCIVLFRHSVALMLPQHVTLHAHFIWNVDIHDIQRFLIWWE